MDPAPTTEIGIAQFIVRGRERGALEGKGEFGGGSHARCTRRNLQANLQTWTSDEKTIKMSGYVVSYQRFTWN